MQPCRILKAREAHFTIACPWHLAKSTRSGTFAGCDAYEDYRELCARDDIDAIMGFKMAATLEEQLASGMAGMHVSPNASPEQAPASPAQDPAPMDVTGPMDGRSLEIGEAVSMRAS